MAASLGAWQRLPLGTCRNTDISSGLLPAMLV
jgi:hypothetical protein